MENCTEGAGDVPAGRISGLPADPLTELLRDGARKLLAQAIEAEVEAYVAGHAHLRDEQGHRLVVRNGSHPARMLQTGLGPVEVRQARVHDRRTDESGQRIRFTSAILPRYLRRTQSLQELLPWLYLKGISSGQMAEALTALLGPAAPNLSANVVIRLKEQWRREWDAWSRRSLENCRYVYLWVDGIYFNLRLEEPENRRQCIFVIMGATPEGKKELLAISEGYRESKESWLSLLRELKARGLTASPKLAVGDGALGFWGALAEVYPQTQPQRCWVHKEANVLSKLPRSQQPQAKRKLQEVWMAATQAAAETALDGFVREYQAKYPKAAECLARDRQELLTFYRFPAEHWVHLRTINPIESTFSTVRLRTYKTKGSGTRQACLTMVYKLAHAAQRRWRPLNGSDLLHDVIGDVVFVDGVRKLAA